MKKFKVTVNGQAYEVEVEEVDTPAVSPAETIPSPHQTAAAPAVPSASAPAAQPVVQEAPAPKGPIPEGAVVIKAPMPGKISALKAEAGKIIHRGDVIVVLEAMKMQNDITAANDGTLQEIRVSIGDNVKTGEVLAVIVK